MAWGLITYQDVGRREDLLDILADISPDETPLLTLFGTSTARGTLHEWLNYNVTRPTSVTYSAEGADDTFSDLNIPSRTNNITQIIKRTIQVSRTERRVNVAAINDTYSFQKEDELRRLKINMEISVLNAVIASGYAGIVRPMIVGASF